MSEKIINDMFKKEFGLDENVISLVEECEKECKEKYSAEIATQHTYDHSAKKHIHNRIYRASYKVPYKTAAVVFSVCNRHFARF